LRRYLFVAQEGQIRKRHLEEQFTQAACLSLVTDAVIAWNTVYMWEAIEKLKREGHVIEEADMKHLSPARHVHLNVFGKYSFPVKEELGRAHRALSGNPERMDSSAQFLLALRFP